jgi:hypothetical protein
VQITLNKKNMIFGNKQSFAIEIEQGPDPIKGYMRLWINNISIGGFKKQGEFIHAIFDARFFLKNYEVLYEECFADMTAEQINEYVLAEDLIWSENKNDLDEAERRKVYVRFLGDQFDGFCSFLCFCKAESISWIVWNYKSKNNEFQFFTFTLSDYKNVFSDYTEWFNKNLAKYYPAYSA